MRFISRTTAAAAVALLVPAGLAQAQTAPQTAPPQPAAQAAAPAASASSSDTVGLAAAVQAAQQRQAGSVLEAELEAEGDRLVYEIAIATDGNLHQAVVDARSGEVVSVEEQTLAGTWQRWFGGDRLAALQAAPTSIADALAAAEEQAGGPATEVSLEEEDGRLFYEIEVATDTGDREVMIDLSTGDAVAGD
ncbi:PepSY domain-containing protein [Arenibaculum sp.]|uniref:PepSY domain-containing protein n=1 Tax=Arenibaculum sp. TaxID=2865862 RepID=UPI002E0FCE1C|nr:PepSY domain-containing protein [Arenibaculum sp.]